MVKKKAMKRIILKCNNYTRVMGRTHCLKYENHGNVDSKLSLYSTQFSSNRQLYQHILGLCVRNALMVWRLIKVAMLNMLNRVGSGFVRVKNICIDHNVPYLGTIRNCFACLKRNVNPTMNKNKIF